MGGLLIADTLLSVLDTNPTPKDTTPQPIFPTIQGLLTFDTPFCGLSRSLFAYGAFAQYQSISSAYGIASSVYSMPSAIFSKSGTTAAQSSAETAATAGSQTETTQDKPAWRLWQMVAMQTGAAGAIAAAGAAAYMNRDNISKGWSSMNKENLSSWLPSSKKDDAKASDEETTKSSATASSDTKAESTDADAKPASTSYLSPGNLAYITQALSLVSKENINTGLAYISRENIGSGFTWLSSHLTFVSALVRGSELQSRIMRLSSLEGIGFADLYTSLGPNDMWSGGYFVAERTFCSIPAEGTKASKHFVKEVNKKAKDEIVAHLSMFREEKNGGYEELRDTAVGLCVSWANTHGQKGVTDHYRLAHKDDVDHGKLASYTWSEDGGFKEVQKETKGSSWGLGSLTGGSKKTQEKKEVEQAPVTRYVFDKESGFSEVDASGKRVVLSQAGEVVKEEPLSDGGVKGDDQTKAEGQATQAQAGQAEKSAPEEASKATQGAAEEEQVDIDSIPGVTHDVDC
ncbi:MAG: hypothetical protein M1828_003552 [Chrysothrix sp. TS-e1954]|nr:MAG: hypothetical protein M1828_003552 [Chrysothrix sp. TS-e1954]